MAKWAKWAGGMKPKGAPAPAAPPEKRRLPVASQAPKPVPPEVLSLTLSDLLERGDLPPEVRSWVERAAADRDWARANNPPGFVTDEGCWEKAKRAAADAGADDVYAFATWWYGENCA